MGYQEENSVEVALGFTWPSVDEPLAGDLLKFRIDPFKSAVRLSFGYAHPNSISVKVGS